MVGSVIGGHSGVDGGIRPISPRSWRLLLKPIGLLLLLVPITLVGAFAVGETVGGDWAGGLSHVVQDVPLVLLAILAWKRPRIGGFLIVALGTLLLALYLTLAGMPPLVRLVNGLMLFAPAVVSGLLFLLAEPGDTRRRV